MSNLAVDIASIPPLLREWVEEATRTGEVVITRGGEAVAKIVSLNPERRARKPGSARGVIHMAEDFDATPEDCKDYV
jgi:antitoxin (DNA-binding transcriptional repressor) of toxin-antitoxin stability system